MAFPSLALIGGIWLSLLYSAMVMPASVRVIQVTVSKGWRAGLVTGSGLSLGQLPWCAGACLLLFQAPAFWQRADLPLRALSVLFLLWMARRGMRAPEVLCLRTDCPQASGELFRLSFWRSLTMPWRLPLWMAFIVSVSIHLRGPGATAALFFSLGALLGQLLWQGHFIFLAAVFGHRVPEGISLRSLNKLRLLATAVGLGLILVILAPVAFPPI